MVRPNKRTTIADRWTGVDRFCSPPWVVIPHIWDALVSLRADRPALAHVNSLSIAKMDAIPTAGTLLMDVWQMWQRPSCGARVPRRQLPRQAVSL